MITNFTDDSLIFSPVINVLTTISKVFDTNIS